MRRTSQCRCPARRRAATGWRIPPDATLTLEDDETLPTVVLLLTPTSISGTGGVPTVTATLSGVSSEAVTATVAAADGGARSLREGTPRNAGDADSSGRGPGLEAGCRFDGSRATSPTFDENDQGVIAATAWAAASRRRAAQPVHRGEANRSECARTRHRPQAPHELVGEAPRPGRAGPLVLLPLAVPPRDPDNPWVIVGRKPGPASPTCSIPGGVSGHGPNVRIRDLRHRFTPPAIPSGLPPPASAMALGAVRQWRRIERPPGAVSTSGPGRPNPRRAAGCRRPAKTDGRPPHRAPLREPQFVELPRIEPELARCPEEAPRAQRHVAGNGVAAFEDFGDAVHRNVDPPGRFVRAHPELLRTFLQRFTRVDGIACHDMPPSRWWSRVSTSVGSGLPSCRSKRTRRRSSIRMPRCPLRRPFRDSGRLPGRDGSRRPVAASGWSSLPRRAQSRRRPRPCLPGGRSPFPCPRSRRSTCFRAAAIIASGVDAASALRRALRRRLPSGLSRSVAVRQGAPRIRLRV